MLRIDDRMPYMLSERHFMMTLLGALFIHSLGFVAWTLSPKTQVQDIPIRVLNIRLGSAEDPEIERMQTEAMLNSNPRSVDQALANIVRDMQPKPKEPVVETEAPKPEKPIVKQYVREVNAPSVKAPKSDAKSTAKDAEIMSRYTQLISLWIQKFKLYPEAARLEGLNGSTVVRVRIDRKGNVRYYALEYSTGYEALDHAAIDMIKRANPVPAVPSDYPKGELLEFLIPVSFSLK